MVRNTVPSRRLLERLWSRFAVLFPARLDPGTPLELALRKMNICSLRENEASQVSCVGESKVALKKLTETPTAAAIALELSRTSR